MRNSTPKNTSAGQCAPNKKPTGRGLLPKRWSIKDNNGIMAFHPDGIHFHIANNPGKVLNLKEEVYKTLMGIK